MVKGGGKLLRNKLDIYNFESKHLLSMKEALKKNTLHCILVTLGI